MVRAVNAIGNPFGWPPPEQIVAKRIDGRIVLGTIDNAAVEGAVVYCRLRYSALTDEQIAGMSHVARGAEYKAVPGE
jgi:hypothetical protein